MKRWKRRPEGSNWGEFGDDDQIGRMNLLTPERRREAASEIREGRAFTLSLPLDYPGGAILTPTRQPPRLFASKRGDRDNYKFDWACLCERYTDVISDDAVTLYTQYSTQWDSLGHVGYHFDADGDGVAEKVLYNGYRADKELVGPDGENGPRAHALGIENLATAGVQGRGVLVDLHQAYGPGRTVVGYDALMRAMDQQKVDVRTGDFLCIYTGFADLLLAMNKTPDPARLKTCGAELDGRDPALLHWITERGVVAICADNLAVEAHPSREPNTGHYAAFPLHEHCLFKLGVHLGELWSLAELAQWLRQNGRSSFFLTAPPLRLPGSVGSPVTPIATV